MKRKQGYSIFLAVAALLSACLKEGDPDNSPVPVIGFSAGTVTDYRLEITNDPQQVNCGITIKFNGAATPASNVSVMLSTAETPEAILDYNTKNGTHILVLPAANYNLPPDITFLAGQQNLLIPLTVTNAAGLNYNERYAIAVTITGVSGGYTIASDLRQHIFIFSVLNMYDGRYTLKCEFNFPSNHNWFVTDKIEMHTTGPNSVRIYSVIPGLVGYWHPYTIGGVWPAQVPFSLTEQEYIISMGNGVVVNNTAAGSTVFYTMGGAYNSHYDPATSTIYAMFGSNLGAGGTIVPGLSRAYIDTLIRTGPR